MTTATLDAEIAHKPAVVIKPDYDSKLTNTDLAPLAAQSWGAYDIFAFWMSDVHSVGGYITAGSLFSLGLASWQVLIALLVGILVVQVFCNLIATPSQVTGTPFPVICRGTFGVRGANIPAMIRGLIAVAWYGIQTYLASAAFMIVALKFFPGLAPYADVAKSGFVGLSTLGWAAFMTLWVLQAIMFWRGMEAIRVFIDWAGPAVYVVMIALAVYLVWRAGFANIGLSLGAVKYRGWDALPVMANAVALVVSYFSGPMLNFGDFARYGRRLADIKTGNFWGLPVNFLGFSLLAVVTTSATMPVFGRLITDPVETVSLIDSTFAVVLGALTFMIGDDRHQHRRQFRVAGVRLLQCRARAHLVARRRHDRRCRLDLHHAVEPLPEPRGDPLHARHPRRFHRAAVRHPDRRLFFSCDDSARSSTTSTRCGRAALIGTTGAPTAARSWR